MLSNDLKKIISKFKNGIYLETGFRDGVSAKQAIELGFKKVISIEIDKDSVINGKKKFESEIKNGVLEIIEGDSGECLEKYFNKQVSIVYLDAHGGNEIYPVPLEKELEILSKFKLDKNQMIIIDDFYKIKKQKIYEKDNWKKQISLENIKLLIKKFERNFIELPYWSNKKKILFSSRGCNSYYISANKNFYYQWLIFKNSTYVYFLKYLNLSLFILKEKILNKILNKKLYTFLKKIFNKNGN
ncbi:hypothetical protein OA179_00395 [Candidatus Pelagibacter sp.]|nr:hypothetical protein [Candidatus Pelagibacter sp.]